MSRPLLLDLFCCQGGASVGYQRAGFEVVGVDIDPQPRYPFLFRRADALAVLDRLNCGQIVRFGSASEDRPMLLQDFDAIHASPPCQAFTNAQKIQGNEHPDLIGPVRELLVETGKPWVIENVPGAPLENPVCLCGGMFGLETYRHRMFESNVALRVPEHPAHEAKTTKMGRKPKPGEFMHVVGNFSGVDHARGVMGMPWASRDGLREAIPPAYTEFIGEQLLAQLGQVAA